ncbi:MAG: DUF29 domain-containing protein [Stellaceae bacterium]
MMDAKRLYSEDFVLWSKRQANALRAAARGGSNRQLDWGHLAEEIEDLGISQHSALRSHIRRIIRHLIKLEYSRASDPRRGWIETIGDARAEIEDLLETSPSLKVELSDNIAKQTPRAIKLAIRIFKLTKRSTSPGCPTSWALFTPKSRCWATGSPKIRRGSAS